MATRRRTTKLWPRSGRPTKESTREWEVSSMKTCSIGRLAALGAAAVILAATSAGAQEYKIGYITDLSGPLAGSYTPTWEGFELYMKALNDRGGINGRKIRISLDDDGLRADRAVAAAKKQV